MNTYVYVFDMYIFKNVQMDIEGIGFYKLFCFKVH